MLTPQTAFFIFGVCMFAKLGLSLTLAISALALTIGALIPAQQDAGKQVTVWQEQVITTTAQTDVIACGQGSGDVGRKTFVVDNESGSDGVVTVTIELRDFLAAQDFTSGYIAFNGLATGTVTYTTKTPTSDAGRFCDVSAVSASTSTITMTIRRE